MTTMMSWSGSSSNSSVDGWRKGPWTSEEDKVLMEHVRLHGEGRWSSVSRYSGLMRNGKSCRLRWVNYLRPGLKRGHITPQEETTITQLHALWGNKWSTIARYLPGRTDNEIKNYWRTHFKKETKPSKQKQETRKAQFLNLKTYFQQQQQQQQQPQMIRTTSDEFESSTMPRVYQDHDHYFFPEDVMVSAWSEFPKYLQNDDEDDAVFLGGLWNNMEAETTTSTTHDHVINHSIMNCQKMGIYNNQAAAAFGTFPYGDNRLQC